ncbi:uncharacterized protein LOC121971198 [Zingiber officinale]|uniref:uncharacterized protein LOC121971198 n=1 Tax=Zingiber officinale TaxID=94328 RepID=UPI001C4BC149|nr:uncharacterized protein LOC121971198 [Zingiber officinale]
MAALALPSFKLTCYSRIPSTSQENFTFARSFFSSYLASPPLRSSPVDRPSAISLRRHRSLPRASSEGIPAELVEDSKFVPLNADDPIYGPPALLLVGFEVDEKEKIQMFLKELDGDFLKVIYCTEDMIEKTVSDAMHTEQVHLDDVKIAKSLPRLCILSGLSGEEMIMFIDAFPETGLQPAVFAALVPNSADKLLREVIDEIIGDHEMLVGKQSD